ncbi:MAG TPA: malto-oligosyltrehalose synthase, partial [Thermoanaerobaculia bacterium]
TLTDERFVDDVTAFLAEYHLVRRGRINSLAQTTLLLTCPGVADVYQGTEIWDLSLVDPDNRRPVDYELRRSLLSDLKRGMTPEEVLARMDDGLPKLWLIHQGLQLRRRSPEAFGPAGAYEPLRATGPRAEHVVAFLRGGAVAAVAPRLPLRLQGDWQGTTLELPPGSWRDELTGEESEGGLRPVSDLLARFPVALLARST